MRLGLQMRDKAYCAVAMTFLVWVGWLALPAAAQTFDGLQPCRVKGIAREVKCGQLQMPENPDQAQGRQIEIHFAVVPALAKNKSPDPLFVLAGGPGQAATSIAGQIQTVLARINNKRDVIYVDQRGTGRSHPLQCDEPKRLRSLTETVDPLRSVERLALCVKNLSQKTDLAQYATWIAVRDLDAVRRALKIEKINLWGGSYGTRVALEYLRQFPQQVRSAVLDGVAPANMQLPASFTVDAEAALQKLIDACMQDAACREAQPQLSADIDALLSGTARAKPVTVPHPLTGELETVTLDKQALAGMLRSPLYLPQLAAMLPYTLGAAGRGDYAPLFALSAALSNQTANNFAEGMHFAVVCAEDMPGLTTSAVTAAAATRFGTVFVDMYRRACTDVPIRDVPKEFYAAPSATAPVLVLSGGVDPATPPRWGQQVVQSLPNARHLIAPNLGHGITAQGCAPELVSRFIRQATFDGIDGKCLAALPAPPPFRPIKLEATN